MTTMTHRPSTDAPAGDTRGSGGDMVFNDPANGTTIIPSSVLVALFAVIGTAAVAKRVFPRKNG